MRYPEFKWIEVAFNGAQNRGNILMASELKIPDNGVDCYRTLFRYPKQFKEYFDQNQTVKGYKGLVYADFFPVDIDSNNLQEAHENTKNLLEKLLKHYELDLDGLWLFFSGAKGFHVLIPAGLFDYQPSDDMPMVFREIAKELTEDVKIDTSIYDYVRLFRLNNTINSKTGLYKIQLLPSEILNCSIDEIKELAKEPRKLQTNKIKNDSEILRELYRSCQKKANKPVKNNEETIDKIVPPRGAKLCYYNLMNGVEQGNRDNACLRLGVHWLKEFPSDMVQSMLHAWNTRNNPPMDINQVEKVFKSALGGNYDFGCRDSILSEYCDPKCKLKGKEDEKITADKIYTIDEARIKYEEYIARLKERKIVLGFKSLDWHLRGIAPGEVCEVMARTGVGKTAFLLNVIRNVISGQGIPVLFFSLEQPLAQIYERTVQISTEEPGRRVEEGFLLEKAADTLHSLVSHFYKSLYVVDEDMLTYEDLKEYIQVAARDKINQIPPLVCIDYLGRMRGGRGTAYEVTSELARLLKKLAKELDIAILYLHQTSRMGKTGAEEISLDMARDSGVVEEAADFIIGMWRPDMNKPEFQENSEERIVIAVLKNRKGRLGKAEYKFKKTYLKIEEA